MSHRPSACPRCLIAALGLPLSHVNLALCEPTEFMRISGYVTPAATVIGVVALIIGVGWGLFLTPTHYEQGKARIIYIHVPSAMLAINTYFMMAVASITGLVRRHHVSFLLASSAPIGVAMTASVITGALWGVDLGHLVGLGPLLTSVLIMFFFMSVTSPLGGDR